MAAMAKTVMSASPDKASPDKAALEPQTALRATGPVPPPTAAAGFSLVDVLVALVLLGTVLGAALPGFAQGQAALRRANERMAAVQTARSVLAEHQARSRLTPGRTALSLPLQNHRDRDSPPKSRETRDQERESRVEIRRLQQEGGWELLQVTVWLDLIHSPPFSLSNLRVQTARQD